MTVQELIDELQKVEDKTYEVEFELYADAEGSWHSRKFEVNVCHDDRMVSLDADY